jgi:transcriptional regulator with XRE-family HTH domain
MISMTESDLRIILGKNLKRYRTFKGLSQAKLAEILDISPNFISDIETGKRWLSSDTLVNLAASLDVEVYEFLKPSETLSDDIEVFIRQYTEEASSVASEAVIRTLNELRKKYTSVP